MKSGILDKILLLSSVGVVEPQKVRDFLVFTFLSSRLNFITHLTFQKPLEPISKPSD